MRTESFSSSTGLMALVAMGTYEQRAALQEKARKMGLRLERGMATPSGAIYRASIKYSIADKGFQRLLEELFMDSGSAHAATIFPYGGYTEVCAILDGGSLVHVDGIDFVHMPPWESVKESVGWIESMMCDAHAMRRTLGDFDLSASPDAMRLMAAFGDVLGVRTGDGRPLDIVGNPTGNGMGLSLVPFVRAISATRRYAWTHKGYRAAAELCRLSRNGKPGVLANMDIPDGIFLNGIGQVARMRTMFANGDNRYKRLEMLPIDRSTAFAKSILHEGFSYATSSRSGTDFAIEDKMSKAAEKKLRKALAEETAGLLCATSRRGPLRGMA